MSFPSTLEHKPSKNKRINKNLISFKLNFFISFKISFKNFIFRHQAEKKIRLLPEIDGLSKDTVVTSWMAKYDALMKGKNDASNKNHNERFYDAFNMTL